MTHEPEPSVPRPEPVGHVVEMAPPAYRWGEPGPAAVVDRVREACLAGDGHDPLDEAAVLRLKHHGVDGARLWLAGDDGFALLRDGQLDLAVAPPVRGRQVGGRLAAAAVAGGVPLAAWSHGDHPAAARLAARHGLRRARELWVLRRDLDTALPAQEPVGGVLVRGFRAGDAEELLEVNAAAFAGHPEQGAMDAANLAERMAESWFEPEGLLVARDVADGREGPMLGFHWTKRHRAAVGEVYVVGVAPAAQGRGLGRALTLAGLHHLADRGVRQVLLHVEADNAVGRALYEGLGFTHAPSDTHVQYRRP